MQENNPNFEQENNIADTENITEHSVEEINENSELEHIEISEEGIDEPIEIDIPIIQEEDFLKLTSPETPNEKQNKKGLRVFALLIALAVVLTAVATLGYYAGKNSLFGGLNNTSLNLESKPQNTNKYSAEQVYEILNKSVVGIAVFDNEGIKGYASGVIYSEDGYIITNDHIYSEVPSAKFKIYTYDGNIYDAAYIAGDTRSDLAVLKVDSSGFYPAIFGNSDELKFGEEVVAIGRPNDATSSSSITGGYISFLNRRVSNSTSYTSKLIQTDSAINPGSSGGALVNMYGQVVGITSSKLVGSEYEGVGYAIPTTTVKFVVEELIKNLTVTSRAKLGVSYTEIDSVTAQINGTNITGLLIAEVTTESSLYGKISKGDIITEVNGTKILKGETVLDIIEASKPGDIISLKVYITQTDSYKTIEAELVKAESSSSYKTDSIPNSGNNNQSGGGTFDFPYGY